MDDEIDKNNLIILCSQCNKTPILTLNNKSHIILSTCENNHVVDNINIKEYFTLIEDNYTKDPTNSKNNICSFCKNKLKTLIFCINCNKNYCPKCYSQHEKQNLKHQIILSHDVNYFCLKHNSEYISYDSIKKINLCKKCMDEYNSKEKKSIIEFKKLFLKKDEENKIKSDIKNEKLFLTELEKLFNSWSYDSKYKSNIPKERGIEIKKNFNDFKEYVESENNYKQMIINIYLERKTKSKINFQLIQTCKNVIKIINANDPKIIQKLSKENNWINTGRFFLTLLKSVIKPKIIQKSDNNKFENKTALRTVRNSDGVTSITILKNSGNFAVSYKDGTIKIFDSEMFCILYTFSLSNEQIEYVTQLEDDNIIFSSESIIKIMKIIPDKKNNSKKENLENSTDFKIIQTLEGHKETVKKIIELSEENVLVSSSTDFTIILWQKQNNQKYIQYKEIIFTEDVESLLQINYKYFISSSFNNRCLRFFDIENDYENTDVIHDIMCSGWPNSMNMINDKILAVGGKGIYLVDIFTKQIVTHIEDGWIQVISRKLEKDGTFLTAGEYDNENGLYGSLYNVKQFKVSKNELIEISEKRNADGYNIRNIIELDNDYILTLSWCTKLKIWK